MSEYKSLEWAKRIYYLEARTYKGDYYYLIPAKDLYIPRFVYT